jgi:RecG-like helicase
MVLSSPIEDIKGVGPKTAELLNRAGIFTLRDLAYYLPRTYENYQQAQKISDLRPGQVTIKAKVDDVHSSRRGRLTITEAVLRDDSGAIRAIWFNQPYRAKQLDDHRDFYFRVKWSFRMDIISSRIPPLRWPAILIKPSPTSCSLFIALLAR